MKKSKLSQSLIILVFFLPFIKGSAQTDSIASGPFSPTWESFEQNYQCPEWFRDAKFGIWAHWSAQCVPEQGDWYARQMYIQGHTQNSYHVSHYGHPSEVGFMEIDNQWKAEKWDPDSLMQLFKNAGAKYFVALANHHDNLDTYDSKYHEWNTVKVGPKKDIIGTWEKIARENSLYFGVSNHSAHAWHWLQTAYGYDATGNYKGIRYDAYTLTKEMGVGKWWEGLDPQELYTGPNMVIPDGLTTIAAVQKWHDDNDGAWTEDAPANNPDFVKKWYLRCQDLIDKYHPDFIYFDDYQLPLGQTGIDIVAHYYNASINWNGSLKTVVTAKKLSEDQRAGIVEDIERGFSEDIRPYPWQTCSCIGDWHYKRSLYTNNSYKKASQVIPGLIDIVSKNGNLLLSIPMCGDGTIDSIEIAFLKEMGDWIAINGEAIYGTRPWSIYGEGPTKLQSGMMSEGTINFTSSDFRFTTKGDTLYAFTFGWPDSKKIIIKSLAKDSTTTNDIRNIELLGSTENLEWVRNDTALIIDLPAVKPGNIAYTFKITPTDSLFQPVVITDKPIDQLEDGSLNLLPAKATIIGSTLRVEDGGNLGYWWYATDSAYWYVNVTKPGKYKVTVNYASASDKIYLALATDYSKVVLNVKNTGGWSSYINGYIDSLELREGAQKIYLYSNDGKNPNVNILSIKITPYEETTIAGSTTDEQFGLHVYPNPLSSKTEISFCLNQEEKINLKVIDEKGKTIAILLDENKPAGRYQYSWKPENQKGIYFIQLNAGSWKQTNRILVR